MSFARDVYEATEEQTDFTITFPYLSNTHVQLFLNGVEQVQSATGEWTIVSESTARFNDGADVSAGDTVIIVRSTSRNERITDWETGTTLTEDDLDNDSLQAFYLAQEAIDAAAAALGLDTNDLWDAVGKRVTEVAEPTAAADAATKEYVDDQIAAIGVSEGNVPATSEANDGYVLTSGEAAWTWAALEVNGAQIEDAAVDSEHLAAAAVGVAALDPAGGTEGQILTNEEATSVVWADAGTGTSGFSTGDCKLTIKTSADSGWIMADDGTIGSGASGASNRADDDTENLFTLLWDNFADSVAPVTGGRGASAAADWAADKEIQVGTILGRTIGIAGAGASLTSRALGAIVGAEQHTLITSQIPSHAHAPGSLAASGGGHQHAAVSRPAGSGPLVSDPQKSFTTGSVENFNFPVGGANGTHSHTFSGTTATAGSGSAHNNMQPTTFLNLMVKL